MITCKVKLDDPPVIPARTYHTFVDPARDYFVRHQNLAKTARAGVFEEDTYMSRVIYKSATVADIPQILGLWRQFWSPQPYEANLERKILTDPDLVLVAETDGRVIGTILGGFDGWWAWIYRVAVHPTCQKKGIGTCLFREMHKRLAARGADAACLIASPENRAIQSLLVNLGYEEKRDRRYSLKFD